MALYTPQETYGTVCSTLNEEQKIRTYNVHDLDEANETVMKNGDDLDNNDAKIKQKISEENKGL